VQVFGSDGGTGPTGGMTQETTVLSGSTGQTVSMGNGTCKRTTSTVAFGATTVTVTDTCGGNAGPDAGVTVYDYGVTSTGFWISIDEGNGMTYVETFTKQ
jgi:hypothetical protein